MVRRCLRCWQGFPPPSTYWAYFRKRLSAGSRGGTAIGVLNPFPFFSFKAKGSSLGSLRSLPHHLLHQETTVRFIASRSDRFSWSVPILSLSSSGPVVFISLVVRRKLPNWGTTNPCIRDDGKRVGERLNAGGVTTFHRVLS